MQKLPGELLLEVVEQASLEELATLRRLSTVWRDAVDKRVKRWLQNLPAGEQFAESASDGLWILEHFANGRGSSCIYSALPYLALKLCSTRNILTFIEQYSRIEVCPLKDVYERIGRWFGLREGTMTCVEVARS